MDLVESEDGQIQESEYWMKKVKEKQDKRDEFFKPFPELLPPSRLADFKREQ